MKLIKNEKIIEIMQETLNFVDPRLIDHGKRISYATYRILKTQGKHTGKQMRDMCILAMLHDIGAYKTEEIGQMTKFETVNIWEHSIYGFLFIQYFSPLKKLAPALIFHHADCRELEHLDPSLRELAQIISLCDRADVFSLANNSRDKLHRFIEKNRHTKFLPEIIDLFYQADIDFSALDSDLEHDKEYKRFFYESEITREETDAYLKMIILTIDFRSNQTVMHTLAVARIVEMLSEILGFSDDEKQEMVTGAMLHDIGKVGVPTAILEKPDRLTASEMEIMKTHVLMTEQIVSGSVSEAVKQIAIRHHEKLDGAGYPYGLHADALSLRERVMAVADIFSALCGARSYKEAYSQEKISGILCDMSEKSLIDPQITALALDHFDVITDALLRDSKPIIEIYDTINREYIELLEKSKTLG